MTDAPAPEPERMIEAEYVVRDAPTPAPTPTPATPPAAAPAAAPAETPTEDYDLMKEYKGYHPIAKAILWTAVSLGAFYMMSAGCRHIGAGATPSQLERKVQDAKPSGTKPGDYTVTY